MMKKAGLLAMVKILLISISISFFCSCNKSATVKPATSFPDSLALSDNYTPTGTDYANGVVFINKGKGFLFRLMTDYGYYISVNNGPMQKVSLGTMQLQGFEISLSNLLPSSNYVIKGYVFYEGNTYYAPTITFTTYAGTWKRLSNFSLEQQNALSQGPVGFAVNGNGYALYPNGHLYQYNVANDSWVAKNAFNLYPGSFQEAPHIVFTINNIAYLYFRGAIWKYDDSTDTWTNILQQSLAVTLAGQAYTINNKAYILQCAEYGFSITSQVFDPVANTLNSINMTSQQSESIGLVTNTNIYILDSQLYEYGGNDEYPAFIYNPVNNTYTKKDNGDQSGPFAYRLGGVSFTINGKAYVGEGKYRPFEGDYYAYNENTGSQPVMAQVYNGNDNLNIGDRYNGLSFVINGKAYVGFGDYGRTDFWQFTP